MYKKLITPISEKDIRALRVGDIVLINGTIITGRDKFHKYLFHEVPDEGVLPFPLKDSLLYHCGPIVRGSEVIAAGPTTSNRVDMYEPFVIEKYGVRAIMGKGGMGRKTHEAMMKYGCVYLNTIGGASAYLADRIKKIKGVGRLEDFGMAEAIWVFEVEDFPAVVTMDSSGGSLHEEIEKLSYERLKGLVAPT